MHELSRRAQDGHGGFGARERLEARYANYFEVTHSAFEFVLDFGQYHPETASAERHTRLVTGPVYAKLLAQLLQRAVDQFENDHGAISNALDDLDPLEVVSDSLAQYDRDRLPALRRAAAEHGIADEGHEEL